MFCKITIHKIINYFITDYWRSYNGLIPNEKHIQTKSETFTIEGCNSLLRNFLARMRRKFKCHSKCIKILEYSIKLLMLK
ncbi:IS1 family transposase [Candidatus Deianiraea vastatrix]|uniref:IS1 family transposase n=1 Tax=Candidatus Deianiraea vastatrix TaxID=2163644 RepID=UPI0011BFACBF